MTEKENAKKKPGNEDKKDGEKDKKETKEKSMPFVEHLEELRKRLFIVIGSVVGFALVAYYFSEQLLDLITRVKPENTRLISVAPTQMFIVNIKVAVYAGIVFSIPVIVTQFWRFLAPGLYPKERKFIVPIIFFTILCFIIGGVFAYLIVIPRSLEFLNLFNTGDIEAYWSIDSLISFVTMMILIFGLVFEIPLLAIFLGKIGLINHKMMRKYRKYAIFGSIVLGAVLTPPDGFTQLALAIPLTILYEISIWLVKAFGKKPEKEE